MLIDRNTWKMTHSLHIIGSLDPIHLFHNSGNHFPGAPKLLEPKHPPQTRQMEHTKAQSTLPPLPGIKKKKNAKQPVKTFRPYPGEHAPPFTWVQTHWLPRAHWVLTEALADPRERPFQKESVPQLPRGWMGHPKRVVAGATPQSISTEKRGCEQAIGLTRGGTGRGHVWKLQRAYQVDTFF